MLELRPSCECCDKDLPPDSAEARICTYECTFCATCADEVLRGVCPNCGGNLVARPIRPVAMLAKHPASTKRVLKAEGCAERAALLKKGKVMRHKLKIAALASAVVVAATPAFAHLNPAEHGSFAAGFSHPLFGLDHILAMVGVGLWAALLGGRSVWMVPVAFVVTMMAGFGLAMADVGLPFVEPVIAASVVVLGLLALVALQAPTGIAMALVGFFALFHGYAHGGEMGEAVAWPFMAGFAIATAALHAVGVGIGIGFSRITGTTTGRWITRALGGLTALGGVWIVAGG